MDSNKLLLNTMRELKTTDKMKLLKALSEALFEEHFIVEETVPEYGNRVYEIPVGLIDEFPDHPFLVQDDEEMNNLAESIMTNGVLVPALLRRKGDGRYEMLSGHRRLRACQIAGISTLKSIVLNICSDEAAVILVETNRQRFKIRPSEKAFSYKLRQEAIERMPKIESRSYLLSGRDCTLHSLAKIGLEPKDTQLMNRLIRLTQLIPEILDMVDDGRIGLRPAYEMTFLGKKMQRELLECMEYEQSTPTHAQAIRMRKLDEEHALTTEIIEEILTEEKPNQRQQIVLRSTKTLDQIPNDLSPRRQEEYVAKALEFYRKHGGNNGKTDDK